MSVQIPFTKKLTCQDILVNPVLVKDIQTEAVFTSIKKYMNKLFRTSGYKSVTTVTDLKELANYDVSKVEFVDSSVYANPESASYIFCSDQAYDSYLKLFKVLDQSECSYFRSYTADEYITHDEYIIQNSSGQRYLMKISLLNETADIYKYYKGVTQFEGTVDLSDEDQSELLPDIVRTPYDEASLIDSIPKDITFTYAEVAQILTGLGIMKKRKGTYVLKVNEDNNVLTGIMNLMSFIVKMSAMTDTESQFTMSDFTVGKFEEFIDNALSVIEGSISVDGIAWIYQSIAIEEFAYFTKLPYNVKPIDGDE